MRLATTIAVAFGILGNLALTILAREELITIPEYMQDGATIISLSVVLFLVISVMAPSKSDQDQFLLAYSPEPGSAADVTDTAGAAEPTASTATH